MWLLMLKGQSDIFGVNTWVLEIQILHKPTSPSQAKLSKVKPLKCKLKKQPKMVKMQGMTAVNMHA